MKLFGLLSIRLAKGKGQEGGEGEINSKKWEERERFPTVKTDALCRTAGREAIPPSGTGKKAYALPLAFVGGGSAEKEGNLGGKAKRKKSASGSSSGR